MPSKHQRIITAVVERLETILTTNGFETNVGTRVRDSKPNWQQADLPAISVFEMPTDAERAPDNSRHTIWLMGIQIKAFFEKGTDASYGRQVIADIYKAIKVDEQWSDPNPVAVLSRPRRHGVEYDAESFEVAAANVEIEVMYQTEKFNLEQ
jgi:hypothetical protein